MNFCLIEAQVFELDENSYQNLQYSIVDSGDSSYFHLDPSTGVLSISDSAAFDYEINKQFSFQAQSKPYDISYVPNRDLMDNRAGTGSFYNGSIDDLIIYDRVLDADEVGMLYHNK